MGKAIVIGTVIVILGIGAFLLTGWLRRSYMKEHAAEKGWAIKGDLNKAQERELTHRLGDSLTLVTSLLTSSDWMNGTILADADRAALTAWAEETKKYLKELVK